MKLKVENVRGAEMFADEMFVSHLIFQYHSFDLSTAPMRISIHCCGGAFTAPTRFSVLVPVTCV